MHTRNVEYLAICLHLWLAISATIPKDMRNVQTCEGKTESFSWNNDTQNLRNVPCFFKNNYIAMSSSPNFSSVKFTGETIKYRLRVFEDGNVTFQIDNVTTEDSGEYKITLTYINGEKTNLFGRLDVKENVLGNFNITCNDTEPGVCTCGKNTGSDLYTWVFESPKGDITEKTTNESKLDWRDFPKGSSVFCKRRLDCHESNVFNISSEPEEENRKDEESNKGSSSVVVAVAVTVMVILLLLLLLLIIIIILYRRKKYARKRSKEEPEGTSLPLQKRNESTTTGTEEPLAKGNDDRAMQESILSV